MRAKKNQYMTYDQLPDYNKKHLTQFPETPYSQVYACPGVDFRKEIKVNDFVQMWFSRSELSLFSYECRHGNNKWAKVIEVVEQDNALPIYEVSLFLKVDGELLDINMYINSSNIKYHKTQPNPFTSECNLPIL